MFHKAIFVVASLLLSHSSSAEEAIDSKALMAAVAQDVGRVVTFSAEEIEGKPAATPSSTTSHEVVFADEEGLLIVGGASHLNELISQNL